MHDAKIVIDDTFYSTWIADKINDLEANIAWLKKEAELHELAMQQNKDRMQDLEEENATLRQRNAELTDAFTALMEGLEMENIERALNASPEILKTVGCKIAEAAKRNKTK